ncbi:SWIM zinc finger family protein [Nocardiopsis sp. NRRL B-16309]|uniref:SWIM zinc finger family protein n=1 Tax=Nocardiopsis sp. NRRL B-16309 TaxID=1519494 RepID=UPI0006AEE90A|nr:SWIM zinc finger family protein [Nocardiopsis sp. NRRL B-16309]
MGRTGSWPRRGAVAADTGGTAAVWGECKGSGSKPYLAAVHLDGGPAFKCSCPSRKIPCKHVLGLLALWAREEVETSEERPEWVATWLAARAARRTRPQAGPADPGRAAATLRAREEAVAAGMDELRMWLDDQLDAGLAEAPKHGYDHWDRMAKRLVDAKAGGAAALVSELPGALRGQGWPEAVLERLGRLHLLVSGYRALGTAQEEAGAEEPVAAGGAPDSNGSAGSAGSRVPGSGGTTRAQGLDARMRGVVRTRAGIATRVEEVLAEGERVRDTWQVLGRRDVPAPDPGMRARRVWLRGRGTGRIALSLSFARADQTPVSPFRDGTEADTELAFYPDGHRAAPVDDGHRAAPAPPPESGTVADALDSFAAALAQDPWRDAWPVVLGGAAPALDGRWYLTDPSGAALPLSDPEPWRLLAVTGGHPATVAGEWSPRDGLTPLTVWDARGKAVSL